ncbi:MAG: radical SAM protein [Polyangiaceae bacterium]|nr:radical SAM protein [Polyangiaceae bacterium]
MQPALSGPAGQPAALRIVLTYRCNRRCTFCYQSRWEGRQLGARELEAALARLPADFRPAFATFMGGEPTLAPDLERALTLVRRSFPAAETSLTTNGSGSLALYRRLAALGLANLTFSLPALDPEVYRALTAEAPAALARYLDKIRALGRVPGLAVRINAYVVPGQEDAVYRFCKQEGLRLTFCEELRSRTPDERLALVPPAGTRVRAENALRRVHVDADGFELWSYKQVERFDYNNWIVLPDGSLSRDFADILAERGA